ncbi:hypothetical protein [Sulfitobacter noctilucae]|uniref:hypothetical protein n=1 Tax=Sulfitobacter noctilucae TaxID=1342302 RepID=UPI001267EC92|nr:hypothetical protein [Sulfitobacter noctilucae]
MSNPLARGFDRLMVFKSAGRKPTLVHHAANVSFEPNPVIVILCCARSKKNAGRAKEPSLRRSEASGHLCRARHILERECTDADKVRIRCDCADDCIQKIDF